MNEKDCPIFRSSTSTATGATSRAQYLTQTDSSAAAVRLDAGSGSISAAGTVPTTASPSIFTLMSRLPPPPLPPPAPSAPISSSSSSLLSPHTSAGTMMFSVPETAGHGHASNGDSVQDVFRTLNRLGRVGAQGKAGPGPGGGGGGGQMGSASAPAPPLIIAVPAPSSSPSSPSSSSSAPTSSAPTSPSLESFTFNTSADGDMFKSLNSLTTISSNEVFFSPSSGWDTLVFKM
ncbi:hypothetical protein D9757_012447 [Collybiopsis confluens]|uniref:Uncharacterized protein n=1 Tax=Collybiopsis confluens TaxID=2823264 RepID=A0A8H5FY97_9AGAR|nr:hypothetical protein D9757_012447 [Collybiopsis confluens]